MQTHTVSPELQVHASPGKRKQIPRAEHSAKCLQTLCARFQKEVDLTTCHSPQFPW